MSKMQKKAEKPLIDSQDSFPAKECREKIARLYGKDAVALSGPNEGENLADCVCNQLSSRWPDVKKRMASTSRVVRLALKLADDLAHKDDTNKSVEYLENEMKFDKEAATEISSYIKAFAIDDVVTADIHEMMNEIDSEDNVPSFDGGNNVGDDNMFGDDNGAGDAVPPVGGGDEMVEFDVSDDGLHGDSELPGVTDPAAPAPDAGLGGGEEMVSIEIPKALADELSKALAPAAAPAGDIGAPSDLGLSNDAPPTDGAPSDVAPPPAEEVVPGEPTDLQNGDEQTVVGDDDVEDTDEEGGCTSCNSTELADGMPGGELPQAQTNAAGPVAEKPAAAPAPAGHVEEEKKEVSIYDNLQKELDKLKGMDSHKDVKPEGEKKEEPKSEKKDDAAPESSKEEKKEEPKENKEAMSGKATKKAQADGKQVGGVELGNAKDKEVEAPKALEDGNVKPEGHTAGGNKFQDGSTMKNEQKFDPKTVDKGDVSGGKSSLLGADESFPEGGPKVPAGSSPIKGEEQKGGELSTKGTVIATFQPEGLLVQTPEGKKFLAKASLEVSKITDEMKKAVSEVKYEGDGRKFAAAALKAAKSASKISVEFNGSGIKFSSPFGSEEYKASFAGLTEEIAKKIGGISYDGDVKAFASKTVAFLKEAKVVVAEEGVTKTDTSKLEGSNFTNDAEKKPEDGGSCGNKASKGNPDEGVTKTDTSKKEANDFQNDAEKKPEGDKKASSEKTVATAGEKKVEDPKPLEDGNVKPEGHTAGGNKFQDGKTMKNEEKFDAKEVSEKDVSKGDASKMGDEESAAKDGPKVPAESADLSTKGTTIASNELHPKVKEARIRAASAYAADLLKNGEISENEYTETLDKYSQLPIEAIHALIASTKKTRERVFSKAAASHKTERVAGLGIAMNISATPEKPMKERLVECFKLTKDLNNLDRMKENEK